MGKKCSAALFWAENFGRDRLVGQKSYKGCNLLIAQEKEHTSSRLKENFHL